MWFRLVLFALLVLLVSRALRLLFAGLAQGMGAFGASPRREREVDRGVKMVRDPVCGTFVIPGTAIAVRDASGVHHFCSEKCRQAFLSR
ncbi:MAG: hypothetical protein ACM3NQ_12310, partial [Bacteroidales bacterium]